MTKTAVLPAILGDRFLADFFKNSVGFDSLTERLRNQYHPTTTSYPYFDTKRISDNNYEIDIAVAGFSAENLTAEIKESTLIVRGEMPETENSDVTYMVRTIATRSFTRTWSMPEHAEVSKITLKNGILTISISILIPEEKAPKRLTINTI